MAETLGDNSSISHYRILSRIGAGGMGEVYLAEDTRLDRRVALKLLPAALVSDEQAKKRLIREAKAAATLDHPNICAIYEIGEDNGRSFIAMQFVEGETLADRMEHKPLNIKEALDLADQVAAALASAHSRGLIHRDIKPQNMMIAGSGLMKVLDFGLAKRIYDRKIDANEAETISLLTEEGMIIGTVPYMSPEQIRAESLDARSDIFSFGVLLYEMLSGRRPFIARSTGELISAILTVDPPILANQSGPMPARLDHFVRRCLAKEPAKRYQTMVELRTELTAIRGEAESGQLAVTTGEISTLITTPPNEAETVVAGIPVESAKLTGFMKYRGILTWTIVAVVLAISAYALFSRSLAKRPASLTAANSSPAYDTYIRGKVMVNSENQEDNETAIKLLEEATRADRNFALAYAELARAYNRKAFYFAREPEERKKANQNADVAVERALDLDPDLAEAHAARGLILDSPAKGFAMERSIQSFNRAIESNPKLDDPHHQLGTVYFHIGLLDKGEAELQKALDLKPDNTMARFRFGVIDVYRTRYEEAIKIFKSTPREFNPSLVDRNMATALFQLGRMDEASRVVGDYLKTYPDDQGGNVTSVKAMLLAKAGKTKDAEETIQRAIQIGRNFGHFHHTAYNIAAAYALMNLPEKAVTWLETAADEGFPCYPFFEKDQSLDSLRKDQRFNTFMTNLKKQWEEWQKSL